MTEEVWYRYVDVVYAGPVDEYGNPSGDDCEVRVHLHTYPVVRHTRKGVWLAGAGQWSLRDKFVLRDAGKRFACPTIEEAKQSFIARKRRQIQIHEAQVRRARRALELIKGQTDVATIPRGSVFVQEFLS